MDSRAEEGCGEPSGNAIVNGMATIFLVISGFHLCGAMRMSLFTFSAWGQVSLSCIYCT